MRSSVGLNAGARALRDETLLRILKNTRNGKLKKRKRETYCYIYVCKREIAGLSGVSKLSQKENY